jgi:hypothetical protein
MRAVLSSEAVARYRESGEMDRSLMPELIVRRLHLHFGHLHTTHLVDEL